MSEVSFKVTRSLVVTDDSRRYFSSTDTSGKVFRYRLEQVTIYHDGTVQAHAVRVTRSGSPYKSGIGLSMGDGSRYGQHIVGMIELAKSALVQLKNEDHASVMDNCCGGSGYADYAAVPCPSNYCPVTLSPAKLRYQGIAGTGRVARVTMSVF